MAKKKSVKPLEEKDKELDELEDEFLEDAIQKMIFTDVHRLFVYKDDPQNITGVLSLSDAARIRSGSCHACLSSRIRVDEHD